MKKISILSIALLLMSSCNNNKKTYAKIYERKQSSFDSTLLKFNYELNAEKKQDSMKVLATKIIPDSFLISIKDLRGNIDFINPN